jgi:hypothetical protein
MPRVQSSTEQLKDRLSAVEQQVKPLSHYITLLKALYYARTCNTYVLVLEFALPIALILISIVLVHSSEQANEPLVNATAEYSLNSSALVGRQLLVQAPDLLTAGLLPLDSVLHQTQRDCGLSRWEWVDNLFPSLMRSSSSSTDNSTLPLGLQFVLNFNRRANQNKFSFNSPFDHRLEIYLHVPTFSQTNQPFLYHSADPYLTDHLKDFRFGYYQSGFLTLQRCVLEAVAQHLVREDYASTANDSVIDWTRIRFQPTFVHTTTTNIELMLNWFVPQMIALGWLVSTLIMGLQIVSEHRRNTRSLMRILEVKTSVYWAAHLTFNFSIMVVHCLLVIGLLEIWFLSHSQEKIKMMSFAPHGYLHHFLMNFNQTPSYLLLHTLLAYSAMQCSFCALNTLLWRRGKAFVSFFVVVTIVSVHLPQLTMDLYLNNEYLAPELQPQPNQPTRLANLYLSTVLMMPNACLKLAMKLIGELVLVAPNADLDFGAHTITPTSIRFNDLDIGP